MKYMYMDHLKVLVLIQLYNFFLLIIRLYCVEEGGDGGEKVEE